MIHASVRPATLGDVPAMLSVSQKAHRHSYADLIPASHRAAFDARYSDDPENRQFLISRLMQALDNPTWRILVATVDENEIIGYTIVEHANPAQLHGLFVDPDYQGMGIGRQLFEASLADLDSATVRLHVLRDNQRAINLYEEHGFKEVGKADALFFGAEQIMMERVSKK